MNNEQCTVRCTYSIMENAKNKNKIQNTDFAVELNPSSKITDLPNPQRNILWVIFEKRNTQLLLEIYSYSFRSSNKHTSKDSCIVAWQPTQFNLSPQYQIFKMVSRIADCNALTNPNLINCYLNFNNARALTSSFTSSSHAAKALLHHFLLRRCLIHRCSRRRRKP